MTVGPLVSGRSPASRERERGQRVKVNVIL